MPVLTLELGSKQLNKEQKASLISELTDVMHKATGIRKEAFVIYIHENSMDNVGTGGILLSERLKNNP
jgi:4-oxalocrotonate tautomerase